MTVLENLETGSRYALGELLGEGGYGVAYEAVELGPRGGRTGPRVCVKINHETAAWHRECYFGEALRGARGAVQLLDSFVALDGDEFSYCSVFELAHCSLADLLTDAGLDWSEQQVLREFRHILSAVVQLHEWGAMHRDVTPMNILVMGGGRQLKLGDFGIAKHGKQAKVDADAFNPWFAPESKQRARSQWRPRDDVWQLGQLLAALLRGKGVQIIEPKQVKHLDCSDSTKALVYRCLTRPQFRFDSARDVLRALSEGADVRMSKLTSLTGRRLVFTGPMVRPRAELTRLAKRAKAIVQEDVRWATEVVVVGEESPHWVAGSSGTKILQALALRDKGVPLKFITDTTFLGAVAH